MIKTVATGRSIRYKPDESTLLRKCILTNHFLSPRVEDRLYGGKTSSAKVISITCGGDSNGFASSCLSGRDYVPVTDINDDFAGSRYMNNPLVDPGTANTFLTQQSFTTTAGDFVYTFTADQLQILRDRKS